MKDDIILAADVRARTHLGMLQANLGRAFPLPDDDEFAELLVALDRKVPDLTSAGQPRKRSRVLPLALVAVLLTLLFARVAAQAVWELSGERYVDDVVRHELQKDRTTPAVS